MKTNAKTLEPLAEAALLAVYELGSAERSAHVINVAAQLDVSAVEAMRALELLDASGLLWLERCRLTIPGLALAVRIWSRRARAKRHAA
jgi:Mn-dependent DtxR family transcriptional regulator